MWLILSARPAFCTAETLSPPPMTVMPLQAAMASATAMVPPANLGSSKTPMGPFQMTVPAFSISAANSFRVSGPMSTPSQPSGICPAVTYLVSASEETAVATRVSTGSSSFTPLALALSIIFCTYSSFSSSSRELPILPPLALAKV